MVQVVWQVVQNRASLWNLRFYRAQPDGARGTESVFAERFESSCHNRIANGSLAPNKYIISSVKPGPDCLSGKREIVVRGV
jgi:hypothetical protein